MRIETERLYITEFSPAMAEALYQNSLDEDNRRFTPEGVYGSPEEAGAQIAQFMAAYRTETSPYVYAVMTKNGENIGNVQLVWFQDAWEIGYHIAKPFSGRGLTTEAVRAFLPVIAKKVRAGEIYGVCLAENTASRRVLEKAGFQKIFEGMGTYGGQPREICRYLYQISIS